jgi:type I restriction enzyme S subunit
MVAGKGYKQTKIGTIPEDWEVREIGDIADMCAGGTPSTYNSEYWNGNIPWMNSGELNLHRVYHVAGRITELGLKNSSTTLIPKNCILIGLAGQGRTRGTVAINYIPLCTNQSIAAIFPNKEKYNTEYLYQNLKSRYEELRELSTGDGGRGGLNLTTIRNLTILLPSIPEQIAIATVLSDMDEYILSLERLIAKKKAVKQGTMQNLLTGKIRLKGFKGEWVEKKLGEISNICTGKKNNEDKVQNGKYPFFVRSQHVERINSYNFDGEAIIIPGEGNIGEIFHYINGKFDWHQRVYKISNFDDDYSAKYLFFYLKVFFGKHALINTVKATVDSLRLPAFQNFIIKSPKSKDEQTAIATILSDMDAEIETLQAKSRKAKQVKQGAMQQLLTGKIRLSTTNQIQEEEKKPKQANVHFKRSIWAAEIADRLCNEPTFGHVKMEKLLFLTENMCGIDIGSNYHRDAAGPYDNRAIRSIDSQLKKQSWFEVERRDKGYRYIPMTKRGGHKDYFNKYYSEVLPVFDKVINTLRNWDTERCEIVATLYSAWKDLANIKEQYTNSDIINEVINNWHESKKRISRERWQKALDWMCKNGFTPK